MIITAQHTTAATLRTTTRTDHPQALAAFTVVAVGATSRSGAASPIAHIAHPVTAQTTSGFVVRWGFRNALLFCPVSLCSLFAARRAAWSAKTTGDADVRRRSKSPPQKSVRVYLRSGRPPCWPWKADFPLRPTRGSVATRFLRRTASGALANSRRTGLPVDVVEDRENRRTKCPCGGP
jgi:hypothetical protein